MKRKSTLIVIAAISLMTLVGLGTNAEFSDREDSGDQTFASGTLDLTVGQAAATSALAVTNAAPGGSGSTALTVKNVGTVAGALLTVDLVEDGDLDLEVSCTEPEADDPDFAVDPGEDDCAVPGDGGELDDNVTITIWDGASGTGTQIFTGTLSALDTATATTIAGGLAKAGDTGDTKTITIDWSVPQVAGNDIQSDSAGFALTFRLEQFA